MLFRSLGRVKVIQIGFFILLAAAIISGLSPAMSTIPLGMGLFLLGLGWSCTLIAGSTYLSESVATEMKPASQGASDLVMNLMGALGGALSGVIIGIFSYGLLCALVGILVIINLMWAFSLKNLKLNF